MFMQHISCTICFGHIPTLLHVEEWSSGLGWIVAPTMKPETTWGDMKMVENRKKLCEMGGSKNMGKTPKSSIEKKGFPWNKPSILGGFPPIFGSTPKYKVEKENCMKCLRKIQRYWKSSIVGLLLSISFPGKSLAFEYSRHQIEPLGIRPTESM